MTLLFLHAHTYLCTFIYDLAIWKSGNLIGTSTNCLLFPPSPQWIFQSWPSVRRDLRTPCLWFIRGYNTMTGMDADKGDVTWKTVSVQRKAKRSSEKKVKYSSMLCILNTKHRGGGFGRGEGVGFLFAGNGHCVWLITHPKHKKTKHMVHSYRSTQMNWGGQSKRGAFMLEKHYKI